MIVFCKHCDSPILKIVDNKYILYNIRAEQYKSYDELKYMYKLICNTCNKIFGVKFDNACVKCIGDKIINNDELAEWLKKYFLHIKFIQKDGFCGKCKENNFTMQIWCDEKDSNIYYTKS